METRFDIPQVKKHQSVPTAGHAGVPVNLRARSRPAAQIAPKSSLGVALTEIAKSQLTNKDEGDPSSPSSSSDSDNFDDSDISSGTYRQIRRIRKLKKISKKRNRQVSRKGSTIKPFPPKEYDGAADPRTYHRFVMEGEAYIRDGQVSKERRIRVLAHFLIGKGYNFYMQKVASDDPNNWDLYKFFTELFNYSFPIDYRQQMRVKMEAMTQGHSQSVSEYIHELQETFNMVGALTPELKFIKLWYSLRPNIQRTMWKDGLHPDTSSWEEIVAKAEVVEIASKVMDPRDCRAPNIPRSNDRVNAPAHRNNVRNRSFNQNITSRAVTFTPPVRNNGTDRNNFQNRNTRDRRESRPNAGRGRFPNNSRRQSHGNARNDNSQQRTSKSSNLSEKEMVELRAAGKCFECKEVGHMSQNCPQKNTMRGGTSRPPGVPNYSIQMDLIEDSGDPSEILESMPVGMINFAELADDEMDSKWKTEFLLWRQPQGTACRQIGNSLAIMAEYLLATYQPYPGDDLFHVDESRYHPSVRFSVTELNKSRSEYQIIDRFINFRINVPRSLLTNTKFNLCHWYAKRRAQVLDLRDVPKSSYLHPMGDSVCEVTEFLLRQGINSYSPMRTLPLILKTDSLSFKRISAVLLLS